MIAFLTLVFIGIIGYMIVGRSGGPTLVKDITGDATYFVGTLLGG